MQAHYTCSYLETSLASSLASDLQMLWGECISGAMYINDFLALARQVGFADPRELHVRCWPLSSALHWHASCRRYNGHDNKHD